MAEEVAQQQPEDFEPKDIDQLQMEYEAKQQEEENPNKEYEKSRERYKSPKDVAQANFSMWNKQMEGIANCEANYTRFFTDAYIDPRMSIALSAIVHELWMHVRHGLKKDDEFYIDVESKLEAVRKRCFSIGQQLRNKRTINEGKYQELLEEIEQIHSMIYDLMAKENLLIRLQRISKTDQLLKKHAKHIDRAIVQED